MTFSSVFLLKIGKLLFSHYLRNKAYSPTLNFDFWNLYEWTNNICKKILKIRKL